MYIGLISDTHGVLDREFLDFFAPVEQIWHAGDWGGDAEFIKKLTQFKATVGVYGNCDGFPAREIFPHHQFFECGGMRVLMTHIGGYPGHYDLRAQALIESYRPGLFVCGHSHILKVMGDKKYDMLCMNPGAAGLMGWQLVRTALRFRIEGGAVSDMEIFEVPRR